MLFCKETDFSVFPFCHPILVQNGYRSHRYFCDINKYTENTNPKIACPFELCKCEL